MHEASASWRAGTAGLVRVDAERIELPAAARDELARDLAGLSNVEPAWGDAALAFVLEGTHTELLDELAARREAGEVCVLQATRGVVGGYAYPRAAWLRSMRSVDPRLFLRLGLLWAAIRAPWKPYHRSPRLPAWIHALVDESPSRDRHPGYQPNEPCLDALLFEKILAAAAEPADLLTREYIEGEYSSVGEHLPGLAQALVRHRKYVDSGFESRDRQKIGRMLERLCEAESDGTAWLEPIAHAAVSGQKRPRDRARDLVLRGRDAYVPALSRILCEDEPAKRMQAAEVLGLIGGETALAALKAALASQQTARVRSSIEAACRVLEPGEQAAKAPALELPPLYDPQPTAALPDDARALFERACDEWHARATALKPDAAAIAADVRDTCWATLCSPEPWDDFRGLLIPENAPSHAFEECPSVRALFEHPSLTPTHIVRLAKLMRGYWSGRHADRFLRAQRRRGPVAYDLRTVALAYARSGMPADYVEANHSSSYKPAFHWEPAAVWPFFTERLAFIDRALGLVEGQRNEAWACQVLSMFPAVPQRYHAALWSFALDKQEPMRSLARRCLRSSPGIVPRVLAVLSDASHEARAAAAGWLGELGDASAIDALRERARSESHELTKARCFEALEKLGIAPETLLDRAQLAADAQRVLAKGIPTQLAWLPVSALPRVLWHDGAQLPPELLECWIVQAFKQKQSASNGLWKVLARQLERASREHFAWWLLTAWLTHDERPASDDERARDVRVHAVNEKGLLALVGAFGGSTVEAPITTYLNTHYGNRKHQCTYLLDVLAWVDLPIATQRLMRVARGFRTASIQSHAAALVQQIAERKGWTKQELADRAVPDLGLDERATRELAFVSTGGEQTTRSFTLWLDSELTLRLEDEQRKPLKTLPEPRKTESAEHAKQLAKQLRELRKTLKATISLQTQRLFDAMCEQRAWRASDWQECIHGHAVMRALGARLVWTAGGDTERTTFRILDDGSLTSVDDEEVRLADRELVRLAHGDVLDAACADAWSQHLLDFKVQPLFRQFGRARFVPDEAALDQTSLSEVAGAVTSSLVLGRIAAKLGWERGPIGDGPSFDAYLRKFPDAGVVAQLSISHCSPFLGDEPVTLGALSFYGLDGAVSDGRMTLRDVPSVLRTECVNDVRDMAAVDESPAPSRKRAG